MTEHKGGDIGIDALMDIGSRFNAEVAAAIRPGAKL
jgi:hypothetical protein